MPSQQNMFHKKRKRVLKKTFLIYCEGLEEEIFVKHLKTLFTSAKANIKIQKGKGGSADQIVDQTTKVLGSFNLRVVILDNDRAEKEIKKAKHLAKKNGILLIINDPCLEATLLTILDDLKKPSLSNPSQTHKKYFESYYIAANKRANPRQYEKIFPKELLQR